MNERSDVRPSDAQGSALRSATQGDSGVRLSTIAVPSAREQDSIFGIADLPNSDVVALYGDFDLTGVQAWDEHTTRLLARARGVVVELANLRFIDAAGMGALVRSANSFHADGRFSLTLRNPTPNVRRAFAAAGLDRLLTP